MALSTFFKNSIKLSLAPASAILVLHFNTIKRFIFDSGKKTRAVAEKYVLSSRRQEKNII